MQRIEKLRDELATATVRIAELEKGKAAAQLAQAEAVKKRRDAETARGESEQARASERSKLENRIAQIEADASAPYAKSKRWENALYGSIGGLLIVLFASAISFLLKRRGAGNSGMESSDPSPEAQCGTAHGETFISSPAIAIAEDAFGRELDEQVAALNATETQVQGEGQAAAQTEAQSGLQPEPQAETEAGLATTLPVEEIQSKAIAAAPANA
jgi:hypothetical protein